jgi:hypothetical protein
MTDTSTEPTIDEAPATIKEILSVVGSDPGLAQEARQQELQRGEDARPTLLARLARIADAAAEQRNDSFVDGGEETLPVPQGKTVTVVTDRTNGRVVDPDEYEATDEGLAKTAGGTWARGRLRWSLDFAE